ncbi:MAG: tRNA(Met) cytidine acetyltransferase [Halomonas sp.]|nr:GNAT family N-acetyltransferase [Halomonas sp.]TVM04895.1 MAG: tRNA(Met) cytidine acetyltransferase [Halomonas sp.]
MRTQNARIMALDDLLMHCQRLERYRWRQWLWLAGDDVEQRAVALWQAKEWQAPLWVGQAAPCQPAINAGQARTRLGQEHQLIIIDTRQGFDPDAVGALAGTVVAGGLLVLLTQDDWATAPDPDYRRIADYPHAYQGLSAHYLARLKRLLSNDDKVIRWLTDSHIELPRLPEMSAQTPLPADLDCLTQDQAQAVAALVNLKRRRPLVITADRGRGKSAALGIACGRLLAKGVAHLCITAPRPGAVQPVFERLAALYPEASWPSAHSLQLASGQRVQFIAPDALTEAVNQGELGGDGSYLFVDEAAAIPAALLGRWLSAFPRIAFATTVHGYEGSGRGFALRFRDQLKRHTPQWRDISLETPVRWNPGDPLEATLNQLLLLKAELPPCSANRQFQWLSQAALGRDDTALEALFGLLVQSHYRTTPSDIRQLLDGPATQLGLQGDPTAPRGVVVTRDEGGFPADLAEQVARGERRPQGHLLAQSLAAHAGCREALTASWRRVTRIATHPEVRRQGVASCLLAHSVDQSRRDGHALCGATFGAEAGLLAFWQAAGFTPVRLGISRDTTTGEVALMVAKALTPHGAQVIASLRQRLHDGLLAMLAFELSELPGNVVLPLLADMPSRPLERHHLEDISDLAFAHRDPRLARGALQAMAIHAAQQGVEKSRHADLQALARWALQNQPLASSHKASVAALRKAVAAVLKDV